MKAGGCEGLSLGLAAWQTDLIQEVCAKFTLECWEFCAIVPCSRQKDLEDRIYVRQRQPGCSSLWKWARLIHLQNPPNNIKSTCYYSNTLNQQIMFPKVRRMAACNHTDVRKNSRLLWSLWAYSCM